MDLTAAIARTRPGDRLVAVDFSEKMLEAGRGKVPSAEVVVADATALPFEDASFAAVVCGFGVRNLADMGKGVGEVRRVLRPRGWFVTLEFFRPCTRMSRAFHATYAKSILPTLGGWVSGDASAYRYLAQSMGEFLSRSDYEALLRECGFANVRGFDLTLGVASVVRAEVIE
jgi:ubiquinone/menaquinone biosynthesis methyltransferase